MNPKAEDAHLMNEITVAAATRNDKMAQYGRDIEANRMAIAGKVGAAVSDWIHSMTDENYTLAAGAAHAAQTKTLELLESYAYQRGLSSDPRD